MQAINSEERSAFKPVETFRVLALNLWQQYGAWDRRRAMLIDGINDLQPDLVSFAESVKTAEYDQVGDLVGAEFRLVHSEARDGNGMGISIATRWEIGRVHNIDLRVTPRTAGFPCAAVAAEIAMPEHFGPLLFVNHFPNWQLDYEYERELQAVEVARFIETHVSAHPHEQVIVTGDFDSDPDSASVRFWSGRQSLHNFSVCYRDVWESVHPNDSGHTFTPENPQVKDQIVRGMHPFRDWPFRRIGYILLRQGPHGGTRSISSAANAFSTNQAVGYGPVIISV
jgi:endonuclease/exonuclease/phosphatase family metal-dependent hydrolase